MITSTPFEGSQHGTRRTVGLAGLIGAGASFAFWPLMFVWMLVGLTVGMPTDMGGMGLPSVALPLAGGAVVLVATGLLLVVIRLLRRAGSAHPVVVALLGTLLATCLFGATSIGLNTFVPAQTAPGWLSVLMLPPTGACGFAMVTRVAHHRAASTAIALVSAVIIATFLVW